MALKKKKEDIFFTLFKDYTRTLASMGEHFSTFIKNYPDTERSAEIMKSLESECDGKKHKIIWELNESFVTPFDREDIYTIAGQLDDMADFMEDIVSKFYIYNVSVMRKDARELGSIIVEEIALVEKLFQALPDMKNSTEAKECIIGLNNLEEQGDTIYRRALSTLFKEELNPLEVIKWKELYELLEAAIDAGEHLADSVEGTLTKYA